MWLWYGAFGAMTETVSAQAHIGNILLSKFTSYRDFHTMLYTCSAEFDFLAPTYPFKTSLTLLLPSACVVAVMVGGLIVGRVRGSGWRVEGGNRKETKEKEEDGREDHLPEVPLVSSRGCTQTLRLSEPSSYATMWCRG